ncbi:MAG: C-terminal binding protein [Planctomycetes bacterium]|nr:C-terminal binding protein [Planctomycetota bacterium]
MFRVLLTDYAWPDVEIERAILREIGAELIVAERQDASTLSAAAKDADAILTCWARVGEETIAAARNCRIIARLGIGLDNIDVAAATRRGIIITNVPDYCTHEVAEHTIALLLGLARKVAFYHHETKQGRYDLKAGPPLRRLAGQTLGIVGLGRIGREVARQAAALGLNVLATSRRPFAFPDVQHVELGPLLAASDYVSLHLPLSPQTRHLIGGPQLALMKPGAYLINTSRGGLVDHAALAAALAAGQITGAALDVQDPEPPDLALPPYCDPRVIVTPHAAFVSEESLIELRTRATRQVAMRLMGQTPPNVVNPECLTSGTQ